MLSVSKRSYVIVVGKLFKHFHKFLANRDGGITSLWPVFSLQLAITNSILRWCLKNNPTWTWSNAWIEVTQNVEDSLEKNEHFFAALHMIIDLCLLKPNISQHKKSGNKIKRTFMKEHVIDIRTSFEIRPLSSKLYKEKDQCCLSEPIERMETPQSMSYREKV